MSRSVFPVLVVVVTLATMLVPAPAQAEPGPSPTGSAVGVYSFDLEELQTSNVKGASHGRSAPIGASGDSLVVVRYERDESAGGGIQPKYTVGFGWYIYVYLSRSDWLDLAGLGAAGASAALCWWLTPTLEGAVACTIGAYIITTWVIQSTAPPVGYCREFKFSYAGTFAGTKLVKKSC